MIAPIEHSPRAAGRAHRGLTTARRAVADALFRGPAAPASTEPRSSRLQAWLFAAWAMALAASYFAASGWWTIGRY